MSRSPMKKSVTSPKRLRHGDLVRVSAVGMKSGKRLKDRQGQLGRIAVVETTSASNDDNQNNSKGDEIYYTYTVEWVLGGRLTGVRREELTYTTAELEGMTDDGNGNRRTKRRKRERPMEFMEEVTKQEAAKRKRKQESSPPSPSKIAAAASAPTVSTKATKKSKANAAKPAEPKKAKPAPKTKAKAAAPKKTSKKNTKEAVAKKPKVVKKKKPVKKPPPTKKKPAPAAAAATTTAAATKKAPPSKKSAKQEEADAAKEVAATAALALYEKHRREFERILTRLEKVDKFGYFWDEAPPEFDETLTPPVLAANANAPSHDEEGDAKPAGDPISSSQTRKDDAAATNNGENDHSLSTAGDADALTEQVDVTSSGAVRPKQDQLPAANGSVAEKRPRDQPTAASSRGGSPTGTSSAATATGKDGDSSPAPPVFPSHPPFNWKMVRRRMELGRYVLDRQAHEEEQRFIKLDLYYRSLGKHRPRRKFTGYALNKKRKTTAATAAATNPRVLHLTGVDWDMFRNDVVGMCDSAIARDEHTDADGPIKRDSLTFAANKIKENVLQSHEKTGRRHMSEMCVADHRHKFWAAIEKNSNTEAAMQSWRKTPFPERLYERLSKDKVCDGLSELDERIATYERKTSLPDSFVGISYRYDDTGQSEAWMKSVVDETGSNSQDKDEERKAAMALAADDGVTRAQVVATMQTLLIAVQDRVMTDGDVLHQPELRSANWEANEERREDMKREPSFEEQLQHERPQRSPLPEEAPEIVEQPVWGIDKYTRRNVTVCLRVEFDEKTAITFIEKWLLPAINACPPDLAQDIANAARLLEGLPFVRSDAAETHESMEEDDVRADANWSQTLLGKALRRKIDSSAPPWLKVAASELRRARAALGPDFFRVHPKGHGSVMLSPRVKANRLVTFYRGELYPSWRWCEKMDAIDLTQQRKNLKPALPDFYNMALERPQADPRGYGMLFVDASRKAGHGSALSHSCDPTCEVRVAAKNGELCLAMTTLRELEMGEELTFDYNAVTESLNEYRSAVCLCGHNKCRGSFLHFATADCYQQVLNRNAPIASRFSNLVKGSMKKVMSEDDERVLRNHGFHTAAFGAISVNRREASMSGGTPSLLDSLDIVPVWLRTYVADALRYIEYERRALPISLICEHLSSVKKKKAEVAEAPVAPVAKPSKEPGREPSFFYFSRVERDFLRSLLRKEGFPESATGLELKHAMLKVGSAYWQSLPTEKKLYWKERAAADYEKKRKAWLAEQKRQKPAPSSKGKKEKKASAGKSKPEISDVLLKSKISFEDADAEGVAAMEQRIQQLTQTLSRVGRVLDRHRERELENGSESLREEASTICRLQALRALAHSPLRVLDDEKVVGWMWNSHDGIVPTLFRNIKCAPCVRPSLLQKLAHIKHKYPLLERFTDPTGKSSPDSPAAPNGAEGRRLLKSALLEMRKCILVELKDMAKEVRRFKIQSKTKVDNDTPETGEDVAPEENDDAEDTKESPAGNDESEVPDESKGSLKLEGNCLADSTSQSKLPVECQDIRQMELAEDADERETIRCIVSDLVDKVADRVAGENARAGNLPTENKKAPLSFESDPWLEHYGQRFTLQVSADILLLYAHTNNFFGINPYHVLESSPVDVYARELGNSVPRSIVDESVLAECIPVPGPSDDTIVAPEDEKRGTSEATAAEPSEVVRGTVPEGGTGLGATEPVNPNSADITADSSDLVTENTRDPNVTAGSDQEAEAGNLDKKEPAIPVGTAKCGSETEEICQPDDIVASVAVRYQGDYVLSQLLQWYNGGIGQKPGLPDLLGCCVLPSMQGCWSSSLVEKNDPKPFRRTVYELKIRRQLIEWMQDPYQRGNPWPEDVRRAFEQSDEDLLRLEDSSSRFVTFGTPIIDFLVTGDESSIHRVLDELDKDDKVASKKKSDGLLSSLDKGRPAQAVSTWVQCENPECMKWRKIPWHVDVDLLPEKFFCKDNVWNPGSNSCDSPEDDWDHADSLVDENGKVEGSPFRKKKTGSLSPLDEKNFVTGARFDVRRTGKDKYCTGTVVKVDFSGKVKRIQFHFVKTHSKYDEWIEFGSDRIARLNTKASLPDSKVTKKSGDKKVPDPKGAKKNVEKKLPGLKGAKVKKDGEQKVPGDARRSKKMTGKGDANDPLSKKAVSAKRKKSSKKSDGKQSKERKIKRKNGELVSAGDTEKSFVSSLQPTPSNSSPTRTSFELASTAGLGSCEVTENKGSNQAFVSSLQPLSPSRCAPTLSCSIEQASTAGPGNCDVTEKKGCSQGQNAWQERPDELVRRESHARPCDPPCVTFRPLQPPRNFPTSLSEIYSLSGVGFGDSLPSGRFTNGQSSVQPLQYPNDEHGLPSNNQLNEDGFAVSSNYQYRERGHGISSTRGQLLSTGLGPLSNCQFAGNGIGVSPMASSQRNSSATLQETYSGHFPDSGMSVNPFVTSMQNNGVSLQEKYNPQFAEGGAGISPDPFVSSIQNNGVSRPFAENGMGALPNSFVSVQHSGASLGESYGRQFVENSMGASPNSFISTMQNNGIALGENYGRQFVGNGMGASPNSFVASMQNNGISLPENYESPLNTTIHSAAYDLLLLSSVARNNTLCRPPVGNLSDANTLPPTPGVPVHSSGQSNSPTRFPSVGYSQTDQQAIFERKAYGGNPFNTG